MGAPWLSAGGSEANEGSGGEAEDLSEGKAAAWWDVPKEK